MLLLKTCAWFVPSSPFPFRPLATQIKLDLVCPGSVVTKFWGRKLQGDVVAECCQKVLQKCIGMMSSQKARENKTGKKGEEKGKMQKSSHTWLASRAKS